MGGQGAANQWSSGAFLTVRAQTRRGDGAMTDAPVEDRPEAPLGFYHNPGDDRICVCGQWIGRPWPAANTAKWQGKLICFCYAAGVLAVVVFMVVHCSGGACKRDRE